jgi:hypothetical protein
VITSDTDADAAAVPAGRPGAFAIRTRGPHDGGRADATRIVALAAPSPAARDAWTRALRAAGRARRSAVDTVRAARAGRAGAAAGTRGP